MRLMHREVEIEPGVPGAWPRVVPLPDEQPLAGSVVVRLANTTTQMNAYTVRLRWPWAERWYTIQALGQTTAERADERGPQNRWVKVYIPPRGTREILIRFDVPRRPEARAGKYDGVVEVRAQVAAAGGGARLRDQAEELPLSVIVRPFYEWSLDLAPPQRRVGRSRRRAAFEAILTNEGNDWLYCDLRLPRSRELQVFAETRTIAVPPPEPEEMLPAVDGAEGRPGTQRAIPVRCVTGLRDWRGSVRPLPVGLSAVRIDAPSVPPPPDAPGYTGTGAVVATPTSEVQQLPADRDVLYCPPIPAGRMEFLRRIVEGIRTLAFTLLALALIIPLMVLAFQWTMRSLELHAPGQIQPGDVRLSGRWLVGAKFTLTKDGNEVAPPKWGRPTSATSRSADQCLITIPADLNGE